MGLDWVLLCERNVQDRELFERLASELGHTILFRDMNEVEYLRVEDGDLRLLATRIMQETYGLHASTEVALIPHGFVLPSPL